MTEFRPIVYLENTKIQSNLSRSYRWENVLTAGKVLCVPAQSFSTNLLEDFTAVLEKGAVLELTVTDYDDKIEDFEVRWLARIVDIAGYRILVEWVGSEPNDPKLWVNVLCGSVYSASNLCNKQKKSVKGAMSPPMFINDRIEDRTEFIRDKFSFLATTKCFNEEYDEAKGKLFKSKFTVGHRLELLDYLQSKLIYPAKVVAVTGRRVRLQISREDSVMKYSEEHAQMNPNSEFWTDQDSFFIFPVGWATRNGYKLMGNQKYMKHAASIAKDLEEGRAPKYAPNDVTPEMIDLPILEKNFEVGQKFEFLDPLSEKFQDLKVASVLKVLEDGYICVGMDGPEAEEESVPLHGSSSFLFPVGYANQHDITLKGPEGVSGDFSWGPYFKQTRGVAAPDELFKPIPEPGRMKMFKKGYKLEAADMATHDLICPATVIDVKGRQLLISFDGWNSDFDQLFDVDSHDLFPIGWCEVHGYKLEPPPGTEDKKKKKK